MKKRLIGLVTLLMSLGVAGCFGNNTTTTEEKEGYTATEKGHYKIENGKKGDLEPHTYVPYAGDDKHVPEEATCDKAGKSFEICEVCKRINTISSKALGHELIDNGSTAICELAGILSQKCSRCTYEKNEAVDALGNQWGAAETIKDGITKATCGRGGCGSVSYTFDTAKTDEGWNGATGTGNTEYKMGSRSKEENGTWNIAAGAIENGAYAIEMECEMTSSSHSGRYFFNHIQNGKDDPASSDSDKDGQSEAPFRYQFAINGSTNYINPTNENTYGENNMSDTEFKFIRVVDRCEISNITSLTLHHGLIGYSLKIKSVRLVKVD